ncbi:MAG: creatininase family protein, partial [Candidatus Thorarchaeota archaeon]
LGTYLAVNRRLSSRLLIAGERRLMDEKPYLLAKLTWEEAKQLFAETDIAIVPVGSQEQHGPALPLDNDAFQAQELAHRVADKLWPQTKTIVTPLVSYGISPHHMPFAGTITLDPETFIGLIVDIGKSLAKHGAKKIIVMNSHGGNSAALSIALRKLHDETGLWCVGIEWWKITGDLVKETFEPPHFHADEMETSVAWALGQRVLEEKRVDEPGREPVPGFSKPTMFPSQPHIMPIWNTTDLTDSGTIGNATRADPQKGQKIVDAAIDRIITFIRKVADLN